MSHFITKCMINTLPTMTILQKQGHATTNLLPHCGVSLKNIKHMYQCTHEGSRSRWKALVDTLQNLLEARNTDPEIAIFFAKVIFYIAVEINELPQFPKLTLHSYILSIGWTSLLLVIIPTSLART